MMAEMYVDILVSTIYFFFILPCYLDCNFHKWDFIERATVFDSSWKMVSRWVMMPPQPPLDS